MEEKNIEQTQTPVVKAVALKYDLEKDSAPSLVAKGKGETASNIIKLANEHDIPIKKDEDLVELLSQIDIEKEIPGSMYKAVAEIFSFIYDLSNKNKKFMDNYEEKNLK